MAGADGPSAEGGSVDVRRGSVREASGEEVLEVRSCTGCEGASREEEEGGAGGARKEASAPGGGGAGRSFVQERRRE